MPTRTYVGPIDEVTIFLDDGTERNLKRGDSFDANAEDAKRLDEQPENFSKSEHKKHKDGDQ